ncbi:MAG: FmdB family zinc ribbon protein [Bacteroidota bacterium]
MPTYDYKCSNCGHLFEEVQSMKDPHLTKCPNCHNETLLRLIGGGGVIFKGSGFYQTDYKSSGEKKATSPTTEKKTEAKPASDATTPTPTPKKE